MDNRLRPLPVLGIVLLAVLLGWLVNTLGLKVPLALAGLPLLIGFLWQPQWALWLLVATVPVTVDFGAGLTVTRLVMPLVLLCVATAVLLRRLPSPALPGAPATFAAVLMVGVVLLSFITSWLAGSPQFDFELANQDLSAYATRFTLFFVTLMLVRNQNDLHNALRALVIAGTLEAIVVVAQVHFRLELPGEWRYSAKVNVDAVAGVSRAEGTTAHPIYLAGYLQMVLPVALLFAVREQGKLRWLSVAAFGLMLYAWTAAYSRSSLLGLAAMLALALWIWSRVGRVAVVGTAAVLLLGLSAHGWSLTDYARTIEDLRHIGQQVDKEQLLPVASSLQFRIESSFGGWLLFKEHPLAGVGLGQARHHYATLLPAWATSPWHPAGIHNAFLEVASELGLLGITAFLALWWQVLKGLSQAWHHASLSDMARTLAVILGGQAVFLAMTPMVRDVWLTLGLAAALGVVVRREAARPVHGAVQLQP